MVHVHARDREVQPTYDADIFAEIISGIRKERPQLIVCATTSGRRYGELEHRSAVLALDGKAEPDLASLTTGQLNVDDGPSVNSPEVITALAERVLARGIKPELEILELGMINTVKLLSETVGKTTLMAVDPAYRRYDLGMQLQTARLRAIAALGVQTVVTNADRPVTINWYRKHLTYRKIGTVPKVHEFGDPDVHQWPTLEMDLAAWMQRGLAEVHSLL